MRIKFLIQNLIQDRFIVFSNLEILKFGKELNYFAIILNERNDSSKKILVTSKPSIPKIKEQLILLKDENFSLLKEKEFYKLEDCLERAFKKINLSKNKETIRDLEESIPVPFRELYLIKSKNIPKVLSNQYEDVQEKIILETKKAVLETEKKMKKYKLIFEKLKSSPEKKAILVLKKLSKKEKEELSLIQNLAETDDSGKLVPIHLTEKTLTIWLNTFLKKKKTVSIFDKKI